MRACEPTEEKGVALNWNGNGGRLPPIPAAGSEPADWGGVYGAAVICVEYGPIDKKGVVVENASVIEYGTKDGAADGHTDKGGVDGANGALIPT